MAPILLFWSPCVKQLSFKESQHHPGGGNWPCLSRGGKTALYMKQAGKNLLGKQIIP